MSIRLKKVKQITINYLTTEGIKVLLQQPDITTKKGRRDLALLSLMYDTGARVQELIDLTPAAVHLDKPSTIQITGKGNKTRIVPLLDKQVDILKIYLGENDLLKMQSRFYPLFSNSHN
jgi:site-specific recombinase XerD